MNEYKFEYATEKFRQAVTHLAASGDPLAVRVRDVYFSYLAWVNPNKDLPISLKEEADKLFSTLSGEADFSDRNRVSENIKQLNDRALGSICVRTVRIFDKLCRYLPLQDKSF